MSEEDQNKSIEWQGSAGPKPFSENTGFTPDSKTNSDIRSGLFEEQLKEIEKIRRGRPNTLKNHSNRERSSVYVPMIGESENQALDGGSDILIRNTIENNYNSKSTE